MTRVYRAPLIRYIDGHWWKLEEPFSVNLDALSGRKLTVPSPFYFDFNSVPRFFWRIAPPVQFGEAGLVHDYLYRSDAHVAREVADAAHRELMLWKGAAHWRAAAYHATLRAFGFAAFHDHDVAWVPATIKRRR
jgi:hypothetical protein